MNDHKKLIEELRTHAEYADCSFSWMNEAFEKAADAIEQLVRDINVITKERDELKEVNILLTANCNHFKKERDAAVDNIPHECFYCAKNKDCKDIKGTCGRFEWRGVKEDDDEID